MVKSSSQTQATSLENGAEFAITHEYPDGMTPSGEFYQRRDEVDQRTQDAIAIAANNAYIQDGIDKLEALANGNAINPEQSFETDYARNVSQIAKTGVYLSTLRSNYTLAA